MRTLSVLYLLPVIASYFFILGGDGQKKNEYERNLLIKEQLTYLF